VFWCPFIFFLKLMAISRYAVCLADEDVSLETLSTFALSVFVELIGTITLNAYLAIKSYQVQKQIEKEIRLSGATGQLEHLKQKRDILKNHMKPIVILLGHIK